MKNGAPFSTIVGTSLAILLLLGGYSNAEESATSSQSAGGSVENGDATTLSEFEELTIKIREKNQEIAKLEEEIKKYKEEIEKTGNQSKTLQNELKILEATRKKLLTDITLTQKKIDAANLSIESLGKEISDKQRSINIQQEGLSRAIQQTREADEVSLVEGLLQYERLSDFWARQSELLDLQKNMRARIEMLLSVKQDLTNTKLATEKKQRELTGLRFQLSDQKKIVEGNKKQADQFLKETKNKEAEYKKTLAETEARRRAVEEEILNYEAELKLIIDPASYPAPRLKTLYPPLDELKVTQEFGDTDFSRNNPGLYNGKGHNGTDFKAIPGTPVKAAFAGMIQGVGNTDIVCPKASYGRWILIKHGNGLTSLYAHLSLVKVSEGDQVKTGDLIGYSGNTGYTTGPHLHLGLFASQGVRLVNLPSKVCRGAYYVPVADFKAYLNPMLYL